MKKNIFRATVIFLSCFDICCAMQNINPRSVTQAGVPGYLELLGGFINSIPAAHQGDLLQRFNGLHNLRGALRFQSFKDILIDSQVSWYQSRQQQMPLGLQAQHMQFRAMQQAQLQVARAPQLQILQAPQPQTQAQIQLQAPMHATQIDFFQTPALVIEDYFRERSIFGTGRQIPDFRSFNMFFFKKVVEPLENRHMNPRVLDTFMDCCFGEYIDIARFCDFMEDEFSSNPTGFGMLCKALPDQHSLYIAGNLVRLSEDDNFFFPTIVISDVLVDAYIEGVEEPFQMRSFEYAIMKNPEASLVRIEQAIDSYNEFVRKCREFLMDVSMSNRSAPDTSISNAEVYINYGLIDEEGYGERFSQLQPRARDLDVLIFRKVDIGTGIDVYVDRLRYNSLSEDDQKLANGLVEACHLYNYGLLTNTRDRGSEQLVAYKEYYLQNAMDVISSIGQYQVVMDIGQIHNYVIDSRPELYSMDPIQQITRNISPQITDMSEAQFKIRFGNIFCRMLFLCLTNIENGRLAPKVQGIFGSSFDGPVVSVEREISRLLTEYNNNRSSHAGSFDLVAACDSDYNPGVYNNENNTLENHFTASLGAIRSDVFGNYGIYYSPEITKYIAAKLESIVIAIETGAVFDIGMLQEVSMWAGTFLQGFHHCNSGKVDAIFKTFPGVFFAGGALNGSGILDKQGILKILSRLIATNKLSSEIQFYDPYTSMISNESSTYFLASLVKLRGDYGAAFAGGFYNNYDNGGNLLGVFLRKERQQIWRALPNHIRSLIEDQFAVSTVTYDILKSIMNIVMSVPSFIDILLSEDYIAFTDMLISKYLADTGRAGFVPRNNDIKKQILVDILHTYGMLADRRNP